ncbi:carbohydrate sulfotransferase 8-like isoform X1 [Arapaima gigas]
MPWLDCRVVDTRCGKRRLRIAAMNLPCSFWFLLLFAVGGLVLFIHLQDLSEMVQQQSPGRCSSHTLKHIHLSADLCTENKENGHTELVLSQRSPSLIQPVQLPAYKISRLNHKPGHVRVTKQHRKLLLKNTGHTGAGDTPQNSWDRLLRTQEARKHLVREVCARYHSRGPHVVMPQHVSRIFVEDKHKLLYCEVPKAGCSNWKRVLMVLEGLASSTQDIQHDAVHYGNHLRRLDSFERQGITHRLETYTKVLFVREPLERLVSAFRDKFENPNTYYHPVFGRPIISRYRANASQAALRTGTGVTFKEFVQYLLDVHRPVGMDIHWEPVGHLCSPCLLDFDFIGKFETMQVDANFLLHITGAPHNLTFPSFKDRNPQAERTSAHITQQYFAQLNASDRQRVYDFYYMDYLMFNYSKPFKDLY